MKPHEQPEESLDLEKSDERGYIVTQTRKGIEVTVSAQPIKITEMAQGTLFVLSPNPNQPIYEKNHVNRYQGGDPESLKNRHYAGCLKEQIKGDTYKASVQQPVFVLGSPRDPRKEWHNFWVKNSYVERDKACCRPIPGAVFGS